MKWYCKLGCTEPIEAEGLDAIDDHLRVMHPDEYGDGPQRWPDGQIAVVDTTIDTRDFT